jgi:hypothetical protein
MTPMSSMLRDEVAGISGVQTKGLISEDAGTSLCSRCCRS